MKVSFYNSDGIGRLYVATMTVVPVAGDRVCLPTYEDTYVVVSRFFTFRANKLVEVELNVAAV